jgi:5-carboxymethyl-2-hydroxymuconate isomerase
MPHITIEFSANIADTVDLAGLVEILRAAAVETGVFPPGGVRVRAHRADHATVGDGDKRFGFVAMQLRMGAGRDLATRKTAGDAIFAAASRALEPAFAAAPVALSFEIVEIAPELSWKRNTVHDALKARGRA